jgi:hypothetical protein
MDEMKEAKERRDALVAEALAKRKRKPRASKPVDSSGHPKNSLGERTPEPEPEPEDAENSEPADDAEASDA